MTLVTFEQSDKAKELDEERSGLHTFLHRLGALDADDDVTVMVPAGVDGWSEEAVFPKEEAPALVAAVGQLVTARIEKIEAEIRALGFEPSVWSPPDDEDELPETEDDPENDAQEEAA